MNKFLLEHQVKFNRKIERNEIFKLRQNMLIDCLTVKSWVKFNRKIEWNEYFKHWKSLRLVSVLRAYQSGESIQLKLSLKLSILLSCKCGEICSVLLDFEWVIKPTSKVSVRSRNSISWVNLYASYQTNKGSIKWNSIVRLNGTKYSN